MRNLGSYGKYILILFLCLILGLFAYLDIFSTFDSKLQDKLLRQSSPVDMEIVVVAIDDQSLEDLGRFPWPRYVHAELIRILSQGQPAAIGIDIIFSEATEDPEEDLALVEAIREAGNVVLPVYANLEGFSRRQGAIQTDNLVVPFPDFPDQFITGHINTFPDPDGIIRKTALYLDYQGQTVPSFAWRIYEQYCQSKGLPAPDINQIPLDPIKRMEINYAGIPGDYEHISYSQVISGEVPPEFFQGRIVLVGSYTVGIGDFYFTPLAPEVPMYGVEIHANILQNLLHGSYLQRAPFGIPLLAIVLFGAAAAFGFTRLRHGKGLILLAVLAAGYLVFARLMYSNGYLLPLLYPLLLLVLGYLVVLAANYISELMERRRITGVFSRYVAPQVVNKLLEGGEKHCSWAAAGGRLPFCLWTSGDLPLFRKLLLLRR